MSAEPAGRVAGNTLSQKHLAFARTHRRARTLDHRKVSRARRRLAAGLYDSDDFLDGLLETIISGVAS